MKSTDERTIPNFLTGGGKMGELIRSKDWAATPVGSPENWPPNLQIALSIVLNSGYPMFLFWGKQLTLFYNDAYIPVMGIKHPDMLGESGRQVWAEIWNDVGEIVTGVFNGQQFYTKDMLLYLERKGFPEETYWTFSYSPILHEDGSVGGLFCACNEETDKIFRQRRLATISDISDLPVKERRLDDVCRSSVTVLAQNSRDLPFVALYLFSEGTNKLRLISQDGLAGSPGDTLPDELEPWKSFAGKLWQLSNVMRTGAPVLVEDLSRKCHEFPSICPDCSDRAMVLPLKKAEQERLAGVLICGISKRLDLNDEYRTFLELAARQVSAAINAVTAFEEERTRLAALEDLDRSKTVFFNNISHEFRTPLTLMLAPLDELSEAATTRSAPFAELESYSMLKRNTRRLLKLVNNLLDFSRLEAGRIQAAFEPVNLGVAVRDLASAFRSAVESAGMVLKVDCPELNEPVYADRTMLEKIVLNLLSNAFKYTLKGTISVRLRKLRNQAVLSVSDTGVGISTADLPHVFDRFYRVQNAAGRTYEGSGIGLSLVKELTKLHGGEVDIESKLGKGTTITVRLPFGKAHLPQGQVQDAGNSATRSNGMNVDELENWSSGMASIGSAGKISRKIISGKLPHVLFVDDNADMRQFITHLLEKDYEVETAANGIQALQAIRRRLPDLVLADVMMPEMDGITLLEQLRNDQRTRSVPVIFLSARAGEEAVEKGLKTGADDYLVKPFSSRELLSRIETNLKLSNTRKSAERNLRNILMQAPVAITIYRGEDYVVDLANEKCLELWGMTAEQVIGKPLVDVYPLAKEPGGLDMYDRVFYHGERLSFSETPIKWQRDGKEETGYYNFVLEPLRDFSGKVDAIIGIGTEVTGQVLVRRQLEANNEKLQKALETAQKTEALKQANLRLQQTLQTHEHAERIGKFGSYAYNYQTGKLTYSDNLFRLLGCEPGEFEPGVGFYQYVHPDDVENVHRWQAEAFGTQQLAKWVYRMVRKDGQLIWVKGSGEVVTDQEGRSWLVGTLQDITEEENRESELRHQKELAENILHSAVDIIAVFDKEERYQMVNKRLEDVYGVSREDVIGKKITDVFPYVEGTRMINDLRATLKGETRFNSSYKSVVTGRWFENNFVPLREADGEVYGALVIGHDVTETMRAAENVRQANEVLEGNNRELRQQKEFVEALIDNSVDLIMVFDMEYRFLLVNKKMEEMYGMKREHVLGKRISDLYPAIKYAYPNFERAMRGEPVHLPEYRSQLSGRIFDVYLIPLVNDGQVYGVLTIAHDNTSLLETKQKLQNTEEKNRELEQFAYLASHDLREPLNTIISFAELLEAEQPAENDASIYLGFIKDSASRLAALINDLLEHSRIGRHGGMQRVDFKQVVKGVLSDMIARIVEKNAKIHVGELPVLKAFPSEIRLLFQNLISNALKFHAHGEAPEVKISAEKTSEGWHFMVEDNGIGIEPRFRDRIFVIFQRLNAASLYEGTGIGLAHCKKIIDLHGGRIWVESEKGQGSKFHFTLPEAGE